MTNQDYFNSDYVGREQTNPGKKEGSEIRKLLKEAVNEEDMARYGSSKPKRIIIKSKIIDGKS